jgi:hypothetical protein
MFSTGSRALGAGLRVSASAIANGIKAVRKNEVTIPHVWALLELRFVELPYRGNEVHEGFTDIANRFSPQIYFLGATRRHSGPDGPSCA